MNYNRHVEAWKIVIYTWAIYKNDEAALMFFCSSWGWGVEPIFSDG
jgi:hypothetical protein